MAEVAHGHARGAGIVSIFILIFAIVNLGAGIAWATYGGKDAAGIWNGLLLLIAGILGIVTWVKKSKGTMIGFLVLCIIEIITSIVQCALAGLAFLVWQILKAIIETKCTIKSGHCDCGNENVPMELEDCSWISSIEAIFLALLIANGLVAIFVFAGSIIGCVATCCAKDPAPQGGVVIIQQPVGGAVYPPPAGAQQGPPPPGYNMEMTQKS